MTKLFRILILGLLLWSVPASAQRTAPKPEKVHNVILMIGDGMGLGQVAAYMIENQYGPTAFDRAHYTAICKTYSANNGTQDQKQPHRRNPGRRPRPEHHGAGQGEGPCDRNRRDVASGRRDARRIHGPHPRPAQHLRNSRGV